jgi:DNA-binding NarL/FixJ family response regulator
LLYGSIRNGAVGYILKNTSASKLIISLQAIERGEAALSRSMTRRVLAEFQRVSGSYVPNYLDLSYVSERELQVLKLLGESATNREIADRLIIAETTVKVHVHNLLNKLALRNRREAGELARRHILYSPVNNPPKSII